MKSALTGLLFSAVSLVGIAQASAAPLVFTYKGTIIEGTDGDGLFGAAGADLGGLSFELVDTFDVAKATGVVTTDTYNYSYGGANYGSPDYASSKIKIGTSAFYTIPASDAGTFSMTAYTSSGVTSYDVRESDGTFSLRFTSSAVWAASPLLTTDNLPGTITFDGVDAKGGGSFTSGSVSFDPVSWTCLDTMGTTASFDLQSMTISAVPLPASAPLFGAALLGLAAVGYGARRRKTAMAA